MQCLVSDLIKYLKLKPKRKLIYFRLCRVKYGDACGLKKVSRV